MRRLNRRIYRFCHRHPGFGIKNLMLYVVVLCGAAFLINLMDTTDTFMGYIAFNPALIAQGQVWRLVTWIFFPTQDNILFLAIMLYFYYFIGSSLEGEWGKGLFTIYYLLGIVAHILFGFIIWWTREQTVFITSIYLNLSLFFAFALLFPETRVLLFFFIPVKMKWLAIFDALLFAYFIITDPFPLNLLPAVAVLNFLLFFTEDLIKMIAPSRIRSAGASINFKKAAKKADRKKRTDQRYKCAVCGRTDVTNPELEFRYCSRCAGYHCFCLDHINNHIHFTE